MEAATLAVLQGERAFRQSGYVSALLPRIELLRRVVEAQQEQFRVQELKVGYPVHGADDQITLTQTGEGEYLLSFEDPAIRQTIRDASTSSCLVVVTGDRTADDVLSVRDAAIFAQASTRQCIRVFRMIDGAGSIRQDTREAYVCNFGDQPTLCLDGPERLALTDADLQVVRNQGGWNAAPGLFVPFDEIERFLRDEAATS